MCKVSVIVPVYNTEEYLERCINSILLQTLDDIEIIILNDGSTDNSEEIILKYQKEDSRIKYYKHENMGLGNTRNKGVSVARGKYVAFIDSDDYIECDMIKKLYEKAILNNSDVVCCEVFMAKSDIDKKIRTQLKSAKDINLSLENIETFYRDYYFGRLYSHNACDKIYKLNFIVNNKIKFGDNKRIFSEDNFFQLQVLRCNPSIGFVSEPLYNYFIREGSIMNSYKKNLVNRHMTMINDLNKFYNGYEAKDTIQKVIAILIFDIMVMESINAIDGNYGYKKIKESIIEITQNKCYEGYVKWILNYDAANMEPNIKRRKFITFTAYLLKYNFVSITSALFYIKYRFCRR